MILKRESLKAIAKLDGELAMVETVQSDGYKALILQGISADIGKGTTTDFKSCLVCWLREFGKSNDIKNKY